MCKIQKFKKGLVHVLNEISVCLEHRIQERMEKDETGERGELRVRLRRDLVPYNEIYVPMILRCKNVSLSLYFRKHVW